MISVRNIVKVDLDIVSSEKILGDFQTTVYLAPAVDSDSQPIGPVLITDVDTVDNLGITNSTVVTSIKNYFYNGGQKLLLVNPSAYTLAGFKADIASARALTDDFIYVAISNLVIGAGYYTLESSGVLEQIAEYCDKTNSPEKIRLLLTTNSQTFIEDNDYINHMMVVKYCTKTDENIRLVDAALLVGAYFSQVNLDGTDTIRDYAYTEEGLIGIGEDESGKPNNAAENLTQAEYEALVNNASNQGYYNVIDRVGNKDVELGGNLATIEDISIHTDFGAIAIERDITYSVLEKMLGKQYLTEQGISNIKSAINKQLQRYKTNGYLNVGAQYSGNDLSITYNGIKYNVINHGAALPQGFYIFSVPMSNISVTDKQARKFTPIYVILETQDGARVVEITGEVRK